MKFHGVSSDNSLEQRAIFLPKFRSAKENSWAQTINREAAHEISQRNWTVVRYRSRNFLLGEWYEQTVV